MVSILGCYCQLVDAFSFIPEATIDVSAFFKTCEAPSCFTEVAVDLPASGTQAVLPVIPDKTLYIFQRISQEKPDFMREFSFGSESPRQAVQCILWICTLISVSLQQLLRSVLLQIPFQLGSAIHIDRHASGESLQQHSAKSFPAEFPVPTVQRIEDILFFPARTAEKTCSFQ